MSDVKKGTLCAILAWFFPIGLIWFFVDDKMRKNKFAEFHVKQSLVLAIASLIINVVGAIIPILGWFIILPIGGLMILVLWIIGLVRSISGSTKPLPIIGGFGDKLKF